MKFSQDDLIGRKMENGVSGKLLTGGRLGAPHMTRLNLLAGCVARKLPVKRRKIFPRAFINKYIYLKMKNSTIFLFQGRKKKKNRKKIIDPGDVYIVSLLFFLMFPSVLEEVIHYYYILSGSAVTSLEITGHIWTHFNYRDDPLKSSCVICYFSELPNTLLNNNIC